MAWSFDEVNDYVTMPDGDYMTLDLDTGFTMAWWMNLPDRSGSGFQYFYSHGNFAWNNSINLYLNEESASTPNVYNIGLWDNSGNFVTYDSGFRPFTENAIGSDYNNWHHFAITYTTTTAKLYHDGSLHETVVDVATNPSGTLDPYASIIYFGARTDLSSTRMFGGQLAEFAQWDRILSDDEIASLGKGYSPLFIPRTINWYVPMVREYRELINGLTLTNNGSTIAQHPPIIYPSGAGVS